MIYLDDDDRAVQLDVLSQALERFDAQVLAYCLMGNHYHLVLHTRQANLSRLMRHFNGVYTQRFNQRYGLSGHLFQGRFKAILVDRDAYLLALCRYVERNPVAAGLVNRADDWAWSSYRAHLGQAPVPPWLDSVGLMGQLLGYPIATQADHTKAVQIYAQMMIESTDSPLWEGGLRQQVFLGDEAFVARSLAALPAAHSSLRAADGVPKHQTRRPASLEAMLNPSNGLTRNRAMLVAYRQGGFTMVAIAQHVGLSVARVSRVIAMEESKEIGKA